MLVMNLKILTTRQMFEITLNNKVYIENLFSTIADILEFITTL